MSTTSLLSDAKSLIGKSAIYALGSITVRGIGILLLPVYVLLLSPVDYGILAVTSALTSVLTTVCSLSLHGAVARFYFSARSEDERLDLSGTIWITMLVGATAITLVLDRSGSYVFPAVFREVPFAPYLRLAIWVALFQVFSLFPLRLLQIRESAGQ